MDAAINIWQEDKLTELVLTSGHESETGRSETSDHKRLYRKMDRYNLDKGRNEFSGGMKRKTSEESEIVESFFLQCPVKRPFIDNQ